MSRPANHATSDADLNQRRGSRQRMQSRKLQEILDNGQELPGASSPGIMATSRLPKSQHTAASQRKRKGNRRPESPEVIPHAPNGTPLPTFKADRFKIYNWDLPLPSSFHDLSDSRRKWKEIADSVDGANYSDDGSDEWCEISGKVEDYDSDSARGGSPANSMYYVVALVFKNRAKRAFRAGKPWAEFEQDEVEIQGNQTELDNRLRLAIFDVLKTRLCNEIWLEEYRSTSKRTNKSDSKLVTPTAKMRPPEIERKGDPSLEVAGWLIDGNGKGADTEWRCIYADSAEANDPNLMKKETRAFHE